MIPCPDTPAESAAFCLEVLQISPLDPKRIAELFVDALEFYVIRAEYGYEPIGPDDEDEIDAYNRLINRTFGFVKICAIQKPDTAMRTRSVLARMREEIEQHEGADQLYDALDIIERGAKSKGNAMAVLIRDLKKI